MATNKSFRRLATDQAQLCKSGLPPNYFFPPSNADSLSDLTSLSVMLAGPDNTPYSHGVFTLELRMESTYPQVPPTAHFRTKIFHPNVDPSSGAVCVDTLKRDWRPELTLRDVLVTISCLLVCPNPASALNAEAGQLMDEDFATFEKRAALWVKMHAAIPSPLKDLAEEAKQRVVGEKEATAPKARGKKRRELADEVPVLGIDRQSENTPTTRNERNSKTKDTAHITPSASFLGARSQERITIGLGLNLDPSIDSSMVMDLDTPSQAPRPSRKQQSLMMPPPAKKSPIQAASTSTSSLSSISTTTPESRSGDSQPPSKKRRTHSPNPASSTPHSETLSFLDNSLTLKVRNAESDSRPAFAMPWLEWQRCLPRKAQSQLEAEQTLRQAAAQDIDRYNRGDFGPRRGIFRL